MTPGDPPPLDRLASIDFDGGRTGSLRDELMGILDFAESHQHQRPGIVRTGIARELVMDALEQVARVGAFRPVATRQDAPVDAETMWQMTCSFVAGPRRDG